MTAKHQDPQWCEDRAHPPAPRCALHGHEAKSYCRGAVARSAEHPVRCRHIDAHGEPTIDNAAPEHRKCNRSAGGKVGAAKTNVKKTGKTSFTHCRGLTKENR